MNTICLPDLTFNTPNKIKIEDRPNKTLSVVLPSGCEQTFSGRPAWTLEKLIKAGSAGISSAELPAGIRLSQYILLLRRGGVPIRTDRERHMGDYAGTHGRYRLSAPVMISREAA